MVYDYFDKFTFLCQMYDEEADEIRKFVLNFYPFDNSVQIVDTDKEKVLLKRVEIPSLKFEMLQIGNVINIFSKLLQITDCAPATRAIILKNFTSTFALIKPVPASEHGKILTFITMQGFRIVQMKNGKVNKDFGMELYKHIAGNNMLPIIVDYITTGEVIGLELVAENAVPLWRRCLGSTDPREAEPGTLRYLYGQSKLKNVAHGCDTAENAQQAMSIHLAEGKCVALEVKCRDSNLDAVEEFRKLCGPRDPDVCRQLYPDTIRALYGKNIIHNAVHCTDLSEDGETEVEYFFKLLSSN